MRKLDDEGFGLVEMVIAFFLLAIIAVAILPTLWNGISYSSQQSSAATATRYMNGMIETVRLSPTCAGLEALKGVASPSPKDGRGSTITVTGSVIYTRNASTPAPTPPVTPPLACASGVTARVVLTATQGSSTLATSYASVYVP